MISAVPAGESGQIPAPKGGEMLPAAGRSRGEVFDARRFVSPPQLRQQRAGLGFWVLLERGQEGMGQQNGAAMRGEPRG